MVSPLELTREIFDLAHSTGDLAFTELAILQTLDFAINRVTASDVIDEALGARYSRDTYTYLEKAYSDPDMVKRGPEYISATILSE